MFLRHRFDDFVEIFRLVVEGEIGCIDLAGHAPLVNLPALLDVGDGSHPGRPMVLDASKAGFGSEKDIQTVASHRQSEPVGFLGAGFYGFGGDVLVELDDLQSHLSLFSNSGACIIRSLDQISELGSQCPRRRWTHQSRSRGPDPRPANFAEIGSVPLGQGPLVVVLRNIGARGYAEMKIELTHEIEQVTVAVDESWKNCFLFDLDDPSAFRNFVFAALFLGLYRLTIDDDDRLFQRWLAGAVHARCAGNDQRLAGSRALCFDFRR